MISLNHKGFGATIALNVVPFNNQQNLVKQMRRVMSNIGMTEGFDVGLEMSGNNSAILMMLDIMNHGGKLSLLGIAAGYVAVDWGAILFKGLTLKGIYGREMLWYLMSSMLQAGMDMNPIITYRLLHINEFQKGFDIMKSGQCGKVILDWSS